MTSLINPSPLYPKAAYPEVYCIRHLRKQKILVKLISNFNADWGIWLYVSNIIDVLQFG